MKAKILLAIIILTLVSAAAAAQLDPAPTVSIIAIPGTSVTSSVTIRATARDSGVAAGISQLDIYANNNVIASKNCGYSTSCILSKPVTSTTAKNETYYAIAYDRSQNTQSSSITVTFRGVNTPPNMSALANRTINEDSGFNANLTDLWAYVTDTWTNSSNLTYTLVGQTNVSVANCSITNNRWINCNTTTRDAYGFSIISVQATDGQLTKVGNFTLFVAPINDAPVFNTTIPAITFAEDTNYTFNISDYALDVDSPKFNLTFTNTANGNLTVQYTLAGNLTQALLIPAANFNGNFTINFTAYDGENYSNASNNVLVTITPVNDRPYFSATDIPPVGAWKDLPFSYQFNASDIDAGDILTLYDNTSLFNIDLTSGWANFTANSTGNHQILITVCDDSGAVDNCTNMTWNFTIYTYPPMWFSNINVTPASPATYTENATYNFTVLAGITIALNIPLTQNSTMDAVWLEFNGTNYTAANPTGSQYYVNLSRIAAGSYAYRWHGNFTNGLQYNTTWYNYTINKAIPSMGLTFPPGPIITYGSPANVSCSVNTNQTVPILSRNGTVVSNPDMTILGAGTYNYTCFVNATQNYTAVSIGAMHTIHPATVTLNLTLQTPITYGTLSNVTCNASPSAVTPTLIRNGVTLIGTTDNSNLTPGTYNYTCVYNATQNYTGANITKQLIVNKAMPNMSLFINGSSSNIHLTNATIIQISGRIYTPSSGTVNLYINNTFATASVFGGTPVIFYNATDTVPVSLTYIGTTNYLPRNITYWILFPTTLRKINMNPSPGSTINTSFTLSFNTNLNTSCRWSLTDQAYVNMTNNFATTGQTSHSGTISGLSLGPDTVHIACQSETAINNTDLNYNVQNIIEQGSTLINGAIANHSILYSTAVSNSTLQSVNATHSVINGSTLNNCLVVNSTVKNYAGSNCVITNSFVDPPNPGSDLTGSTITGNSRIMNSNVTYSNVSSSNITNSNVNNSGITNSEIESSTMDYCILTNSDISGSVTCINSTVTNSQLYNLTTTNAVIINGTIINGTVTYNGTNYTNGTILSIVNLPPTAAFTYSPSTPRRNRNTNFNAGSSSDLNTGDTLTYFWDFGDGTNGTGVTATHKYTTTGTRTVTLTVTDSNGLIDNTTRTFNVAAPVTTVVNGGGGGGGGGSSYYASRNWHIDLDSRSLEIITMSRTDTAVITLENKTYTFRMTGVDRNGANFTISSWPYSLVNYEIEKVDLDNDGISEIRIILLNNYFTRAQLRFDKFEEIMSTGILPANTTISTTTIPEFDAGTEPIDFPEDATVIQPAEEKIKLDKNETGKETTVEETEQESWLKKLINTIYSWAGKISNPLEKESKTPTTVSQTSAKFSDLLKNKEIIGIGITLAIVIAGLIVYFLFSLIFV